MSAREMFLEDPTTVLRLLWVEHCAKYGVDKLQAVREFEYWYRRVSS